MIRLNIHTYCTDTNFDKCIDENAETQVIYDTLGICTLAENDSCVVLIQGSKNYGTIPSHCEVRKVKIACNMQLHTVNLARLKEKLGRILIVYYLYLL